MEDTNTKNQLGVLRLRKLRKIFSGSIMLTMGLIIFILVCSIAIFAPYIAPHQPGTMNLELKFSSPSIEYPFGNDQFGRCIFSRMAYGARTSLTIATVATGIVVTIGILVGLFAGYYRRLDPLLMRITDIILAFPDIVLAIAIVGIMGPSPLGIIIAFSIPGWAKYARVIRSSTLSVKNRGFIEASKAVGATDRHIIFRHILPYSIGPIIEIATLGLGARIIAISGLGFLGLGIQPPTPEWGTIMKEGLTYLDSAPLIAISTGFIIMLFVLSTNLIGSEVRALFDPRSDNNSME
ncbi:MAG: Oligopeptide ABC transporter, permease protein [Methanocalculus sp. 52_23]|jgi:peptide/nickel transport system permease protein|uniref:ABC transporter permease n=1 Tax=Methanocalculus sp. TaxID=2004547 RepID=UPI00074941CE|nr:ABC transporter permease [Methanocalculus sp.]KUK68812.1 MAG: Oligopeptide ABC transporter, permease protein [Methanocalculus sp. 52_23]HIJ06677.1 ABC transporter permease [Methanocalculus sp.]